LTGFNGFIDLHTHGLGRYDTKTDLPEDILQISSMHAKKGTGAILVAVYPGPVAEMRRNLEAVKIAMDLQRRSMLRGQQSGIVRGVNKESAADSALILGVHLEGPFLNPENCGSMNKDDFLKPSQTALKKLIAGYEEIIRIITIAPEMPGALRVIERCAELGMKINMGHSSASFRQALDGKKAGATGVTHLFNAMRPFHHREPGLSGLGLIDKDLYIEVIADGIHLHPSTLKLIFSTKCRDRIILVSDSVKGKAAKGAVYSKTGVLAGSAMTLSGAVRKLRSMRVPETEILKAAIVNPATYIGLK
jgi:N-acetylglucosamine-6-phosphate deacetylase